MKLKFLSLTIVFSFVCFIVYGQSSTDSSSRMKQLETTVYHLLKKNKDLESRIAKLESTPASKEEKKVVQRVYSSKEVHDLSREVDNIKDDLDSMSYKVNDFQDFLGFSWSSLGSGINTLEDIQRQLRMKADGLHFH